MSGDGEDEKDGHGEFEWRRGDRVGERGGKVRERAME